MNNTFPRVSHLSDPRQFSGAVNHSLRKTDALELSADQQTLTVDRDGDVTGDWNVSGVYKVAGTQVVGAQQSAIANISTTATAGTLPTPNGSVTIANAATPTVTELLEYCVELEAKLEAALAALRTHGLIAP